MVCRASASRGPASPSPELGLNPAHSKDEAAVAAAAALAMLCYVTRPDAVLMEVEVEAKANGEDCLNQVRTRGQARGPGRFPEAEGPRCGAGTRRLPGAGGAAAAAAGLVRPRRPACAPSSTRPWGARPLRGVPGARGGVGVEGAGDARRACPPAPQPGTFPEEGGPAHLPQVCE